MVDLARLCRGDSSSDAVDDLNIDVDDKNLNYSHIFVDSNSAIVIRSWSRRGNWIHEDRSCGSIEIAR